MTFGTTSVIVEIVPLFGGFMKRDTQVEKKILDFLLDHTGQKFYLTQIAKEVNISDSTVWQILEKKEKEGLVKKEKIGNLSFYCLDFTDPVIQQMKQLRTVKLLKPVVEKLKDCSQKVILFGSAAEGKDLANSDIDLFVLTGDKKAVLKIISQAKIGRKIQLVAKNILEWQKIKKEDKIFAEEVERGKILWKEEDGRI